MRQWPLPRRQEFIRQLHDGQAHHDHQLEFQGALQIFKVHVVPIALPCYRLSNRRTRSAQQEMVSTENLPEDFFSGDPDSDPALKKQHEILTKMVTQGIDAEIQNILRRGQQLEPLILDKDGYVVNGNRRLCAMRLLLEENENQYERYRNIQVAFLPACDGEAIDELEIKLQYHSDGRSDYSWVDKAMMLRDRRLNGWNEDRLSKLFEISTNEIRKSIAMLEDAEAYLEERGCPRVYSKVLRKELAFDKLQKGRKKCEGDEPKKRFFTSVAYLMLDDPDAAGRRLYESIPDALKYVDEVAQQLKEDFSDQIIVQNGSEGSRILSLDILGDDSDSDFTGVANLLTQPEHFHQAREVIRDKIEEMRTRARERRDANYCLREVQKACTALQNARTNLSSESETQGIEAQLDSIETVCRELRSILTNGDN